VMCWTTSTDEAGLFAALPVGEVLSDSLFPSSKRSVKSTKVAPA
jgi:hypothetical protein